MLEFGVGKQEVALSFNFKSTFINTRLACKLIYNNRERDTAQPFFIRKGVSEASHCISLTRGLCAYTTAGDW